MNLNELFSHHKGTRSYDDLERACDKALTSQRLQQIATTQPKDFPKAANVPAIAKALGVTEMAVVLAAAESLGLDVQMQTPRLVQVLPSSASDLSDEEVAALAHVIRAFKEKEVGNDAGSAANTKDDPAGGAEVVEFPTNKPPKQETQVPAARQSPKRGPQGPRVPPSDD